MAKELSLGSRFEDIYKSKNKAPELYSRLAALAKVPEIDAAPTETEPRIEVRSAFETASKEFGSKKLHTPEEIVRYNQVLWEAIGAMNGEDVTVPVLSSDRKSVSKHERLGRGIVLIAEGYTKPEERYKLGIAAEKLIGNSYFVRHWSIQQDNPVLNDGDQAGYRAFDIQLEAPNLDTTEEKVIAEMKRQKAEGMNLTGYILANIISKATTGHYLDERTWSRLPGSSYDGRMVGADVHEDGCLYVSSYLDPQDRYGDLGARFSPGVK